MRYCALALLAVLATGCASTQTSSGSCPVLQMAAEDPVPTHPEIVSVVCPAPASYPFRNLVLEGGGVKGIAYAGAFEVLDQQKILDKIGPVAGTSAGAITATLVALRYPPDQIKSLIFHIPFEKFKDGGSTGLFRLFRRFGWFKGDYFLDLMRCLVTHQTKKRGTTFKDMQDMGYRDLHVFSTDLSTGNSKEFSAEKTPDVEVALAVRMSMSIPLFFASVDFDKDTFVDGGVLRNYPIDAFDTREGVDPATLGLHLNGTRPPRVDIKGFPRYTESLFSTLLDVQVIDLETNLPDLKRSVLIDNLGISTTDFNLTRKQKLELIAKGVECTCRYLKDWQSWQGSDPASRFPALSRALRIHTEGLCGSAFGPGKPK
ncbi:MAG TPA: patatin-like phospholipase family protein [Thermoanaerobaculia bacterium]|jgi:NTE family protein|nr:patatin-like phospholipase family protein [Thermoanaerobaculia bacterium]